MARREQIIDRLDQIDAAQFTDALGKEKADLRDEIRAEVFAPYITDKDDLPVTFGDLIKALRALDRATPIPDPLNPPPTHDALIYELQTVARRKLKAFSR